jgi:hypothetical protein
MINEQIINPFIRLSKWACRQGENYTTESFAILLDLLKEKYPAECFKVVKVLTNNFFQEDEVKRINFNTQFAYKDPNKNNNYFFVDFAIELKNNNSRYEKIAFVEVKIQGGSLQYSQLSNYMDELNHLRQQHNIPKDKTRLILLPAAKINIPDISPDAIVLWREIGKVLQEVSDDLKGDEVLVFLISSFMQYLRDNYLYSTSVKNPSQIIKELTSSFKNYEFDIGRKRQVSPNKIINKKDNLKDFFNSIKNALNKLSQIDKLISYTIVAGGEGGSGWIAYSINKKKYFVGVQVFQKNPTECLYFTSHNALYTQTSLGEWSVGQTRWDNKYELIKLLDKSQEEQEEALYEFIKESYEYAEKNIKKRINIKELELVL